MTTQGALLPGVSRHYIRINPGGITRCVDEDPNRGTVIVENLPPGVPFEFPAGDIVDAGFLELVRYGIRDADAPIVNHSLRVVDVVLKVDTPFGACWHRCNHDGSGEGPNGEPFRSWA